MPVAQQPQARDSAYKTILDKLNTAQSDKDIEVCLLAMGNLGHPDSLPVLEPFLSHENETMRAVATSSLRFIETPAAERLLMRMLRDASREVRLQAIEAFNHRRISQALLPELAQYLREESQKDLRRALIDALWLHRSRVSGVRPLIAQAATGDPDEEIRLYAQGLLQQKE
jgi:HEAT repeat protein